KTGISLLLTRLYSHIMKLSHFGFSNLKAFQKEVLDAWFAHGDCILLAATKSDAFSFTNMLSALVFGTQGTQLNSVEQAFDTKPSLFAFTLQLSYLQVLSTTVPILESLFLHLSLCLALFAQYFSFIFYSASAGIFSILFSFNGLIFFLTIWFLPNKYVVVGLKIDQIQTQQRKEIKKEEEEEEINRAIRPQQNKMII
ncbi:hypothetical protein ACJX0J_037773, partial [Zea mays]